MDKQDKFESDMHYTNKLKLYNLLKQQKVTLIDQNNKEYSLYTNNKKNFLFLEPIVLIGESKALLKNKNFPCLRFMAQQKKTTFLPKCDFNIDKFSITEQVPCYDCLIKNLDVKSDYHLKEEYLKSSCLIPDISYGYNGYHQVWIEVLYSHPCTEHKINIANSMNVSIFFL